MLWMQKLRMRVLAMVVALILLVLGVVGVLSVPVLPAVGVALTIAVTVVNTMASRLSAMTCAGCGQNIEQLPAGTHGIACRNCGTINHPFNTGESQYAFDLSDSDDEDIEDPTGT